MSTMRSVTGPANRLAALFRQNGYVRRPNADRRADEGYHLYKKGAEVRLVAPTTADLEEVQHLLTRAGFKPARPFAKGRKWCQPVYGMGEVDRFLALVDAAR